MKTIQSIVTAIALTFGASAFAQTVVTPTPAQPGPSVEKRHERRAEHRADRHEEIKDKMEKRHERREDRKEKTIVVPVAPASSIK